MRQISWITGLLVMLGLAPAQAQSAVSVERAFNGYKLYGNIQVVDSFPDIKVEVVDSFPDLKVEVVESFADECGKWKFVDNFPDVKIQYVDSFPDIKIQFVTSFPGLP